MFKINTPSMEKQILEEEIKKDRFYLVKTLYPAIMLMTAILYMLTVGNQITDSVSWQSYDAHASSDNLEQWEDYSESLPDYPYEFDFSAPEGKKWVIYDIDRLARAVARHETGNCTLGYGKEYNNCFGIKNGNTAPCDKIGRNRMCIYEKPEDSYVAFKIIWSTWYRGMPNLEKAQRWSNDRAEAWLKNVNKFY